MKETELVSGMCHGVDYISHKYINENHHIPIYKWFSERSVYF